jgi:hypothetical protein
MFIDEAAAREGEHVEPPSDVRAELEHAMKNATYYDLHRPRYQSA